MDRLLTRSFSSACEARGRSAPRVTRIAREKGTMCFRFVDLIINPPVDVIGISLLIWWDNSIDPECIGRIAEDNGAQIFPHGHQVSRL